MLQRYLTYYNQRKGQPLHVKLTTPKPVETPKPEESEETSKESTGRNYSDFSSRTRSMEKCTQALQDGAKATVG